MEKGFRFDPFDEELITHYLKPLVVEKQNPCSFIEFRDVYGACSNPWLIFPKDDPSWFRSPHLKETEKCMFIFSKLTKLSRSAGSKKAGSKKGGCVGNTMKTAGSGTWGGKSIRKQIRDAKGNVIGEHRYLVFELNEIDSGVIGCDWRKVGLYRMHEYSLSGINAGLDSGDTIVLCKIIYDSSKECMIKLKSTKSGSSNSEVDEKEVIMNTNLEGVSSETNENLSAIDGGVDDRSITTQDLDVFDQIMGVSLEDIHWITEYLNSDPQNEPIEESMSNLGKRISEAEEDSLSNKKALINNHTSMITGMKMRPDENLKLLHSILYGKTIKVHVLKRNIGLFSGFVWDVNEKKQRLKVKERIDKCVRDKLLFFVLFLIYQLPNPVLRRKIFL